MGPADELLAPVSEELFRLRVYRDDPAIGVDDEDGVRRGLAESSQLDRGLALERLRAKIARSVVRAVRHFSRCIW